MTTQTASSPLPAGTIVHVGKFPLEGGVDWSEKATIGRVTGQMKARPGQFDPLANGWSPVRFQSGGCLLIHRERLMIANDQSAKARAALKPVKSAA